MALEKWGLRARKAIILPRKYRDIPLHINEKAQILEFTPEVRGELEGSGFKIYLLTGQSIETLRDAGKPFWTTWHKNHPELEKMTSRLSQVAINPKRLFLPGSNQKTFEEQIKMMKDFSAKLRNRKKIAGFEAVIGAMPDYVELAFSHLSETGRRLFGENYNYGYVRSNTRLSNSNTILVGRFYSIYGLSVGGWDRGMGMHDVFVAPLIVPAAY